MRKVIIFTDTKNKTFIKGQKLENGHISFSGSSFTGTWRLEQLESVIKAHKEQGDIVEVRQDKL